MNMELFVAVEHHRRSSAEHVTVCVCVWCVCVCVCGALNCCSMLVFRIPSFAWRSRMQWRHLLEPAPMRRTAVRRL